MKEYKNKKEEGSRALQPSGEIVAQSSMERIMQRYTDTFGSVKEEEPASEKNVATEKRSVNMTGLPVPLKEQAEDLSGFSMDDVRVHFQSDKPQQLHALAYTQGADIYIAPGQDKYLPHELWHVVQQKQDRVHPTIQTYGRNINDDKGLENEADKMGNVISTVQTKQTVERKENGTTSDTIQCVNFRKCLFEKQDKLIVEAWNSDEQKSVNNAIASAIAQLDKAVKIDGISDVIKKCIPKVINVLSDSNLTIFYLNDSDFCALSVPGGPREISLNMSVPEHQNVNGIAKTLIHEAFHIACGGVIKGETSCNSSWQDSFKDINKRRKATTINPDTFAQFVMLS